MVSAAGGKRISRNAYGQQQERPLCDRTFGTVSEWHCINVSLEIGIAVKTLSLPYERAKTGKNHVFPLTEDCTNIEDDVILGALSSEQMDKRAI